VITYHIGNPSDLYSMLREIGGVWRKPIRRILHLLLRKRMLLTVFVQIDPRTAELVEESEINSQVELEKCVRLHFFAARFEREDQIPGNSKSYRGYCDIRSDGTVAKCNISLRVIIRPDTYTYLVCQSTETVELPTGDKVTVTGFLHVEKNQRGLMCSQAAIANVVHYWNAKRPGSFSVTTPVGISKQAGVSLETLKRGDFEGLSAAAVKQFFQNEGFFCYAVSYETNRKGWRTKRRRAAQVKRNEPGATIYGFLESGLPVIAVVKTANEQLHALTVIGHTFDKNVWLAYADPFYFNAPLTGAGRYHSNLAWVRFFIVQDDNLGPYFFAPRVNLAQAIDAIIVPLPVPGPIIGPTDATNAAFLGIAKWVESLREDDPRSSFIDANLRWLEILKSHTDPDKAGGWVLRPFLKLKDQIGDLFVDSEFASLISEQLRDTSISVFWVVELSWPNLYCYEECKAGEIILDAATGEVWLIHIPGVLAFPWLPKTEFAKGEDAPGPCFPATPKAE
jgi:hypothetical protein